MKIGVLISRTGPAGIWGPSSEACAILAAAEINAAGGVMGRNIELTVADPGWTETEAVGVAADMVDIAGVDAVVGMHPSNVRTAIRNRLAGRVPYFYTPQYEGGEAAPTTVAIGATDGSLMRSTLPWFVDNRKARRFCLVANDYVWPQRAMDTASAIINRAGGRVVGEMQIPFGADHTESIDDIRRLKPDVLVIFLLGEELVRFNRTFGESGLSSHILRFALGFDENVLYGIGSEASENLYGATTFVSSARTAETARLLELYHSLYGEHAPQVSVFGQSSYEGIHLAAAVAKAAGSTGRRAGAEFLARSRNRDRIRDLIPPAIGRSALSTHFFAADGLDLQLLSTR
ncbi:substrate-binding domain-containing protein [Chthonobacter albigriseus]|uniref:substrate-binding domain-containing protein n=1 Tax=Chthonobacter albigriseus TaxID=1683161 RepID=UPI0015EF6663|nr:substrate-binding domain-containing protein [Chthonobacter albigriseus]